jgi:hypothetical protein
MMVVTCSSNARHLWLQGGYSGKWIIRSFDFWIVGFIVLD